MRNLLIVSVLIILAFIGGRLFYYGYGSYSPPSRELSEVELAQAVPAPRRDAPYDPAADQGVVVVDYTHNNALYLEELSSLFAKVVDRGFRYEITTGETETETEEETETPPPFGQAKTLADKLRYAQALILPVPRSEYTAAEVAAIERFIEKGGRLLLIGDPTRTITVEALNSIAGSFDVVYPNDYVYSLQNNDNNYRNVIYTNFMPSPLTENLVDEAKVIFYSAGSVAAPDQEIILGDESTHSSLGEGGRTLAVAALTANDRVLALGDLTFFSEPHNAAESNGQLVNNIADFLTGGQRDYELKDFPYFFSPDIDIVFDDSLVFNSQFDDSVRLKEALEGMDHNVSFTDRITTPHDVIYVGRFDNPAPIDQYLAAADITLMEPQDEEEETTETLPQITVANNEEDEEEETTDQEERFIDGRIQIGGVGELEQGGSTLFYLHQTEDRNVLVILSDNPTTNADAFNLLLEQQLADCLAAPMIAVCQTEEPAGKLPPSLRSSRINRILVVSDDDGRPREDQQTGAALYYAVLSDTYQVGLWSTTEDGSPPLDELLDYDAIIWSTGDYWDDSIGLADVELLTRYIELGGNLLLSGASIGFDWDHTDFLTQIVHADYLDFAPQADLEPALAGHLIVKGFAEGEVITLTQTPSGEPLDIDVVRHTADARVIFQRGPDSQHNGAASVIAYEDRRVKVAYFAFPFYLLNPADGDRLVNNTVDWFSRKPQEPPVEEDYEPYELEETGEEEEQPPEEEEETTEGEEAQPENGEETPEE